MIYHSSSGGNVKKETPERARKMPSREGGLVISHIYHTYQVYHRPGKIVPA